jgi:tetratricopeptide (TPR) repeat protein
VFGVLTMSLKNIALAVPISAYKPDRFGPLKDRSPNREMSSELLRRAEAMNPGGRGVPSAQAMLFYEMALLWDSGNAALYAKLGQLNYQAGRPPAAAAYLVRSLRMQPWSDSAETYRNLGLALAGMQRPEDALSIWEEGLRKYPTDNAQLWGDFAVALERQHHYYESALSARIAIKTYSDNAAPINQAYKRSVEHLAAADLTRLLGVENDLDAHLARLRADADKARRESHAFMLPEAEKVVTSFAGIQQEAIGNAGRIAAAPSKALQISDEELAVRFIRNRIDVAKEHIKSGNTAQAVEILEDLLKSYPAHPETESARLLLRFLRKN